MSRARDLANGTFSGAFSADSPTLVVDAANNRVGIGTASPAQAVDVSGNVKSTGQFLAGSTGSATPDYSFAADNTLGMFRAPGVLGFSTGGTERARIDSSGNLLVGTTDSDPNNNSTNTSADNGFAVTSNVLRVAKYNDNVAVFNRTGSDGIILGLRKSGTTVGGISTLNGDMYVAGTNKSLMFSGTSVLPRSNTGGAADATVNLGGASNRYNNIYASNGTINTSDASQKQQIASLTDDEITAAKAISKLFKTYKWNSAVEAEGDAARTHAGVVAQEVEQAMTDAGLDATQYGFFCSDTWWEADETYTDDDGVEQNRTITYDIVEEAPANATERTRLGIRYPELLAFIGAATEQRLASIEARLDALEAV